MRRKLFFVAIIIIAIVFLCDKAGIPLSKNDISYIIGHEDTYIAKVMSIETFDKGYKMEVSVLNSDSNKWSKKSMLLSYYDDIDNPWELYKAVIEFECKPEVAATKRNPGTFDYYKYLKSKGIEAVATIKNFNKVSTSLNIIEKSERFIISKKMKFLDSLDSDEKGITAGILFGDTSFLEEDIYDKFKENGTAHVLAVSGLHVGILFNVLQRILGKIQKKSKAFIMITVLIMYGTLALWSPSAIRAVGMICINIFCKYNDRRYDFLTAMSVIIIMLIIKNPYVVFNTGFQMSFLAASSIAFFMPRMPRQIPDSLVVMPAVNIGLFPYQWFNFNLISPISFLANIPIVYMMGILLPVSMVRFLLYCIGANFGAVSVINEALAAFAVKVNDVFSLGGIGTIEVASPPAWVVIFIYVCVFFAASETFELLIVKRNIKKIVAVFMIIIAFAVTAGVLLNEPIRKSQIIFVDVGQGDCIHIKDGKYNIMIDGGGNINYNVGSNTLKPYLLKNGVSMLNLAIATHEHTDHYKGLEELQDEEMITEIYKNLTMGISFDISKNCKIETLWPISIDESTDKDANKNCSVFMIYYKNSRVLITGDLDDEGERNMMEFYKGTDKLKADILKMGHHGSKYSTSDEFLEAVSPKYCVIQVGKNNYGHPNTKIIEKCLKKDIILLRNDMNGAIGFFFGSNEIGYETMIDHKG